ILPSRPDRSQPPKGGAADASVCRTTSVRLPVDLPHDFRPAVDDRQHRVGLLRREHRHDAGYPDLGQALDPVEILAKAKRGEFGPSRIAAGLACHVAEFWQDLGDLAARRRYPTIAIADRAPRAIGEGATDMDRRVRFLHRSRTGDHRIEMDELAMVFRLGF